MEIEFENVSYKILNNINIKFKENKINSIIGTNGSGKSTLISLLNGNTLTEGNIKVDSNEKIGIVCYKNTKKTVKEEIEYNLKKFEYETDNVEKRIIDSLKTVGLDKTYLDKDISSLSSGEIMKILIASTLSYNPKVIIFDELTCLDSNGKNNLIKIIRMLKNRYHKTIIFVSNDIDLVHKISDYIYLISNGKLVFSGNKYEVFTNFEILKKYSIDIPNVVKFSKMVLDKKGIKIGYRDEINDLLKDIYRYAK